MSSEWIKCTRTDGTKPVYLNLAIASTIEPKNAGTRVEIPGSEYGYVDVKETPDEVLRLLNEIQRAERA